MMEVRQSTLRDMLLRHLTPERVIEIMTILEPLYAMCTRERFFYGHVECFPSEIHKHIQFLTQRPCDGIEFLAESVIPQRLLISVQNTNISVRSRSHMQTKLFATLGIIQVHNFDFDFRFSFGNRLMHVLPQNLWNQLWETVRYWLLCEIALKPFKKEAAALQQMVCLCASGYIPFDFNPIKPTIAHIVNEKTSTTNMRYRTR
ncbi:MAG: hypothetical protein NTX72_03845 [Candidatus Uhrbacteria bacterium]|nr:hypothetical protein [Candidatus Uhrbacteria bacterium]